ncbi:MAG TPA: carbohydrate ABC transporter permease [Clostridiales bacterium]|nr:carbohydrate ABC transporter permease [Clostridiales bacterium]
MKKNVSISSFVFDIINFVVLTVFGFLCFYPFYYMLIYSLSDPVEATKGVALLPRGLTLKNYWAVIHLEEIPLATVVSVFRTILAAVITIGCSSFLGYLVTKKEMYFRKFIYRYVVATMYVGGGLIPTYLTLRAYGLRNTFFVYIIPGAISAYYVVLTKTFFEQIPESLEESAMLEGAGILTCWARIVMPLSKPILATIAVFSLVAEWNYWFDSHIYITNDKLYTLQYVLYLYNQKAQSVADALKINPILSEDAMKITPATVRMTITAVVTIPILMVYPFMQRYFVKGMMIGAIKG